MDNTNFFKHTKEPTSLSKSQSFLKELSSLWKSSSEIPAQQVTDQRNNTNQPQKEYLSLTSSENNPAKRVADLSNLGHLLEHKIHSPSR